MAEPIPASLLGPLHHPRGSARAEHPCQALGWCSTGTERRWHGRDTAEQSQPGRTPRSAQEPPGAPRISHGIAAGAEQELLSQG